MGGDYYDWRNDCSGDPDWSWGTPSRVFDLDTGRELHNVLWLRISTGEYEVLDVDEQGRAQWSEDRGEVKTIMGRCRLRLEYGSRILETPS